MCNLFLQTEHNVDVHNMCKALLNHNQDVKTNTPECASTLHKPVTIVSKLARFNETTRRYSSPLGKWLFVISMSHTKFE